MNPSWEAKPLGTPRSALAVLTAAEVAVTNVWLRDRDLFSIWINLIMCASSHGMSYTAFSAQGVNFVGLLRGSVSPKSNIPAYTYSWPRPKCQTNPYWKNKYHITIVAHHCGDCEMIHFLLDIGPKRNQTIYEGLAMSCHYVISE